MSTASSRAVIDERTPVSSKVLFAVLGAVIPLCVVSLTVGQWRGAGETRLGAAEATVEAHTKELEALRELVRSNRDIVIRLDTRIAQHDEEIKLLRKQAFS